MAEGLRSSNVISSFKLLKGNTKVSVLCEPLWGIPFNLFNFYLSLYMKSQGVTDKQIGYIISIGFISSIVFSLYGGVITDALGRKRTTLIFDFIAWPLTVIIYMLSSNFWLFALATLANSTVRVVSVSWNLMVIEDADSRQRQIAFNLLNIINISVGIIIPAAGILVSRMGIASAERIFLAFGAVSMSVMIILRNAFYTETRAGLQILEEREKGGRRHNSILHFYVEILSTVAKKPTVLLSLCMLVLYNVFIPLGSFSSLYFAPYMTEVMKIDASKVSVLGGAYSVTTLLIFIFVNPIIGRFNRKRTMVTGLVIQIFSFILLITVPRGSLIITIGCVVFYASGFSIFRPLIDSLFADATDGNLRAGFYSVMNTATCTLTAITGAFSGYLYELDPRSIYVMSIGILTLCIILLALSIRKAKNQEPSEAI